MNVEHRRTKAGSTRKKRKYLILGVSAPPATRDSAPEELEPTAVERITKSRHERIAELAYYRAERRGFTGGDPDRDWHEAEMELEELLRKGRPF